MAPVRDLPRVELMKLAAEARSRYPHSEIYFKFTCEHCGERCTFQEPNRLYESGECSKCGKETKVDRGGFMVDIQFREGDSHE